MSEQTPPGPTQGGLLAKLWTGYRFLSDSVGVVSERFERHGDIYYVPGKPDGLYVLRHPDHVYRVLVEQASSFTKQHDALERLSRVLGGGLLTSDGDAWRRHRRMIQPAFQHARLVGYCSLMTQATEALAERWHDGATVDMGHEMMTLTLDVVCRALFSHDAGQEASEVAEAMATLQDSVTRPDLLPAWFPSPGRRRLRGAIESLDRIIYGMIRARRGRGLGDHDDLLDRLLSAQDDAGTGLTEREVRDELVTLFLAGHETTAQALTWTWYLLSQHPEVAARLGRELSEVLGGRSPSYEDLDRLPYTEQVIEEAMRLYPPVYVIARRAAEDVTVGEYRVPRGSELVIWVLLTHRDPRWYPEPLSFRPERFAPEAKAALPRAAYVPFGAGPRTCIGKVFAMLEARLILATLFQRFRPALVPGHRVALKPRVTLTPEHGMPMRLRSIVR
ncbi:MAG: cytochrome P450 [Myxococcales bacterium]|nr:cytochrome P450 [Myxococcales bacterium]